MRMRLGLLHDPEAQARMYEREQKAAEDKKRKAEAPTVRSEEEQRKHDEQKGRDENAEQDGKKKEKEKEKSQKVRIRPLSDAKAIELGANFFSETFIFLVAVSLLLAENYRSSRSARNKRDELAERVESLEAQVERLRDEHNLPELEALNERLKKSKESKTSWWNPAGWWRRTEPDESEDESQAARQDDGRGSGSKPIPGNVPNPSPEKAIRPAVSAKAEAESSQMNNEEKGQRSGAPLERVDSVQATKKER